MLASGICDAVGTEDYICIAGRRLILAELINIRLSSEAIGVLSSQMVAARPFAHLVLENVFHPDLLELVLEEFDSLNDDVWREARGDQLTTRRSLSGAELGPAMQLYFAIVNSGPFLRVLSALSGVEDLIVDPTLHGGGLHETRNGGRFGIHCDYHLHPRLGLRNELVLITYLNKQWGTQWSGALELWDADKKTCERKVEPEFGRSILMRHGPRSFHGHPTQLSGPEGTRRRSIVSYYYSNRESQALLPRPHESRFLFGMDRNKQAKRIAKALTPPIFWNALRRLVRN